MRGTHHYVYPSSRCMHLYINIIPQEAENDVKHLLVMPLVIGVIRIRDRRKESLKQTQGTRNRCYPYKGP